MQYILSEQEYREYEALRKSKSDIVWGYEICAYNTEIIHHGEITGQGDTLPSLQNILLDWQADVNIIVVEWARQKQEEA